MSKPVIKISVSEGQTYKRCWQLHDYKFRQGLTPRVTKRPLKLGGWVHTCLQHLYDKSSWRGALETLIKTEWEPLFEEERVLLGDLPRQTQQLMELYDYYYQEDPWEVVEVAPGVPGIEVPLDFKIETTNYIINFVGRMDLVVRDKRGLIWVIDHKSMGAIPKENEPRTFQIMDTQLTFYPYGLKRQYGLEAFGTMYNYLRSKAPTIPHLNKPKVDKKTGVIDYEMSRQWIDTDVLTFERFCKEKGFSPEEFAEQYEAAQENTPTYFYRMRIPRDEQGTLTVMQDLVATAISKSRYGRAVRNVTYMCPQCEMLELCQAEFFGHDTTAILSKYIKGDPYKYLNLPQEEEVSLNVS